MASIINASTSTGLVTTADTSGVLQLQTGGTTAVTVDASQNVGIGATPSAWNSAWKGLQVVSSSLVNNGFNDVYLGANYVFDSTSASKYINSDFATLYGQVNGAHQWFNAASGTAGNTISFTQAMTLLTTGELVVGAINDGGKLTLSGTAGFAGNGISIYETSSGNNARLRISQNAGAVVYNATYSAGGNAHTWQIGNVEAARIDSSGNLLVGTTTPILGKMTVAGGITSSASSQFNIYSTNSSTDFEWVLRTGARQLYYVNNAAVVASLSLTGVWTNASDARYKENITDSQYGLATVMALKPRAYNLIDQADKPQIGFIAQEVLDVVPEVVDSVHNSVTDEDRYTLSYGNMVAVLTKAIQEQQAIIQTLTDRITALEGTTP